MLRRKRKANKGVELEIKLTGIN
jgi:hypothetical protein